MLANAKSESGFSPEILKAFSWRADLQDWQNVIPVPARPEAVAQLQLLASSHVADLDAITDVIRNDIGLTIQLLQFGARNLGTRAGSISSLDELVVQLGLEQLRTMAAETVLMTPRPHTAE
jgi:HD-like signal output (HDOD) protein